MSGPFAKLGRDWQDFADGIFTFQSQILRRVHGEMADALDRAAMRDVEGARDWRDLQSTGDRYADR